MRTNNVVRIDAMAALVANLGAADAERFIILIKRREIVPYINAISTDFLI